MASIHGKRVVFTGELESMTRAEAQAKAKALGATVASTVNAETDLLVAGPGAGSKLAAALKHGVKVLNETQWLKIAGGGNKAAPAKVAKTPGLADPMPRRLAAADLAARIRRGGRLRVGGGAAETSHTSSWVVDSRGNSRDVYWIEWGRTSLYAVFDVPARATEAIKAIEVCQNDPQTFEWSEGPETYDTTYEGRDGPFCAKTKRRLAGEFHAGDMEVVDVTLDGEIEVEFEAPDGTREPIETDEALSLLKALAAEPGGKAPKKAAKKKAQSKSSKKAAQATTRKTSKQSSKKAARATKKTAKTRSRRR